MPVLHHVKLTANDRLEVAPFCLRYKLESAKHIPVVRQGNAFLAIFGGFVHHGSDLGGAIEQ
jgi:hypothetical protein